ncbi:MAG: LysE family translocator [Aeromonas sp.]|uniref:LysE family translocator n=1 Tax=Aeromonas sp. TaxID=647 RepID=UPI003F407402
MSDWALLWMFVPTFFLISVSPGLCMMLAMSVGASLGLRRTLWVIAGELLGVGLIALTALLGYTQVLVEHPALLQGFKYGGALYLLWLGVMGLRPGPGDGPAPEVDRGRAGLLLRGFTVAISNPKSWLFMMTLLPPFISPDLDVGRQTLAFVAVIVLIECVNLLLYAYGGQSAHRLLQGRGRGNLLGRISALLMMGIALYWLLG